MSVSFDWKFGKESPSRKSDEGPSLSDRIRHWLRRGVVLFILLVPVGLVIRAWVADRLDKVAEAEAELQDVVELELKTVADGDVELFRSRQDPTDAYWQDWQVARYVSPTAVTFVPAPGLTPADRPSEVKQVHFFGRTGRVELIHWFQPAHSHTPVPPSPFPFHTTWFYRRDEEGTWYHVAPPEDYWGIPYSWHGSRLDVHATKTEAQLLDPIARELAILMVQGCQLLDCPRAARYTLIFTDVPAPQVQGGHWALPALYLTGLPEGEDARAAWLRALKLWMVEALVQAQVDDEGLAGRVIYRQLVRRLQAELGLVEPLSPDITLLTQAVAEGKQHTLLDLWEARYEPGDPEDTPLLEAEVVALLMLIEEQVGADRLFDLLSALRERFRPGDAALYATYDLDRDDFTAAWYAYLSELTGVPVASTFPIVPVDRPLEPLPLPAPPPITPGNQIALICDGRIWVGNADGSDLAPLTAGDQRFITLDWSPNGRWLLTMWRHGETEPRSALYLLAADGGEGRLLTDDHPVAEVWYRGLGPDGRQAIYDIRSETRAVDVETGEERRLPGVPFWSPNGEHLAYVAGVPESVWLADADWGNARRIDKAGPWWEGVWSPDSSKLALIVYNGYLYESTIAVYDLATDRLTPLITRADLTAALLSLARADRRVSNGDYVTDGADPDLLADRPLRRLWPLGWSADSSRLLIEGRGPDGGVGSGYPYLTVLAAVPLDGSTLSIVAYGADKYLGNASWSPTDPDRLTFTWWTSPQGHQLETPESYLIDLYAGPVYSATHSPNVAWSPDGAWVAFTREGQVVIVDQEGQERFTLQPGSSCTDVAWNPVADLSGLGETLTTALSMEELWHKLRDER